VSDPVCTTPKKFEKGVFTLKTHQMFCVHTTPEKFWICVLGDVGQGNHLINMTPSGVFKKFHSQNAPFSKCFRPQGDESRRFQIPPVLKSVSEKPRFHDGLAAFSTLSR